MQELLYILLGILLSYTILDIFAPRGHFLAYIDNRDRHILIKDGGMPSLHLGLPVFQNKSLEDRLRDREREIYKV